MKGDKEHQNGGTLHSQPNIEQPRLDGKRANI